jgi:hypothetical protein
VAPPPPGDPAASPVPAEVKALRVRIHDHVAMSFDGDVPLDIEKQIKGALEMELGRLGLTVVGGRDKPHDLVLKLDSRVIGAVYFVHGHVNFTAENQGVVVAMGGTGQGLHKDSSFAPQMAQKLAAAFVHSPALVEFARRRSPRREAAGPGPAAAGAAPAARPSAKPGPDAVATAKARFKQGTAYYNLNRFAQALVEFEAAYLAAPDPAFLFNIGQCHRKMGHRAEALGFYRTYLRNAPSAPNRADVEKLIQELEAARPAKATP